MQVWTNDYLRGTGMEMYTETLSPSFIGMPFAQATELCFTKLKLLLLAIEVKGTEGADTKISINPRGAKIVANTQGFFIAQSADEVKRAWFYCKACHDEIKDETLIKKCKCKNCELIFLPFKLYKRLLHQLCWIFFPSQVCFLRFRFRPCSGADVTCT
jgi:potassium large conductance calcium-activated channel subfamily M alpha protein 1